GPMRQPPGFGVSRYSGAFRSGARVWRGVSYSLDSCAQKGGAAALHARLKPRSGVWTFSPVNPKGISPQSPGLERSDYPGWKFVMITTPTGLRQPRVGKRTQPFQG